MKIRNGFVSNSSSSSFVISKSDITESQIDKIKNHIYVGEELGMETWDSPWDIDENESSITGYTYMDNFDMQEFLEKIGVDREKISWDD